MEVFDSIGVLDRLLKETVPVHTQTIYAYGKLIRHNQFNTFASPHAIPVLIGQNSIERILSQYLAENGTPVERDAEVVEIRTHIDFV